MNSKNIDIIIPIYNAYDEVVLCLNSVKKWTNLKTNRLILINDCSSDERIETLLNSIMDKHIIAIHNKENMGFSANINIGMNQSDSNDVILLNSDTIVTEHWVEKIITCAYSDKNIATVTPLSNSATLCSVPDFCKKNNIPKDFSIDEYANIIENISMNRFPDIPVAHGFCMFIKREVIKKIGGFDAKTFQKGYGEENDFCYRLSEIGYRHVMCDNTFIFHKDTSSFKGEDKEKLSFNHEKILDERYPKEMQSTRVHCRDNPNKIISCNVFLRMELERAKKRKTILYLLQSDFHKDAEDNIGGVQLHVRDLTYGLRKKYNIVVVARNNMFLNVTFYTEKEEFLFKFYIGSKFDFQLFRSKKIAEIYGKILDSFRVNQVHIHHTISMTLELFYESKKRNIPICVTLHDFYYICPNIKLLDEKNNICIGKENELICKECLKNQQGIANTINYINEWRYQHLTVLKMADKIVVPSENTKKIIGSYYKEIENKLQVIGHGSDAAKLLLKNSQKNTFNVAFLGAINVAKGFNLAIDIISKSSKDIRWHLMGYFERPVPKLEHNKNFMNIGPYQREKLPDLIQQYNIDLICILSICPETFCYTLSEAVLLGIPVLATDIGALGERVHNMRCGWTVPVDSSSKDILQFIERLKNNSSEYQEKQNNVQNLKIKTKEQMCEEYINLYKAICFNNKEHYQDIDNEWLIRGYLPLMDDENKNAAELQLQLNDTMNSLSYKLLIKVKKFPIPFKKQIKMLIYKIIKWIKQ